MSASLKNAASILEVNTSANDFSTNALTIRTEDVNTSKKFNDIIHMLFKDTFNKIQLSSNAINFSKILKDIGYYESKRIPQVKKAN